MGKQFHEGFDLYETGSIFDLVGGLWGASGTIANVNTSKPRTGTRALQIYNNNTQAQRAANDFANDCYLGAAFNEFTFGSAPAVTVFMGLEINGATSSLRVVRSGVGGTYSLYRGTTLLATGTGSYANDAYHYLLIYYNRTTGAAKVWIDRNLEINIAGIVSIGVVSSIGLGAIGNTNGAGQPTYWDDLFYWTDPSAGDVTNIESVLDFQVRYGFPDANGGVQNWTVTGAASAFQALDNVPPNSGEYIEAAAVADISDFDIQDISTGVFQVFGAAVHYYAQKTTAGSGNVQASIGDTGTFAAGANNAMATTYAYFEDYFTNNPFTGVPWVPADLDTLEIQFERTA